MSTRPGVVRFLRVLGVTLLAGGTAHSLGVARLYLTSGVPDANRVLVDAWVAQAQLLGGGLYIAAAREAGRSDAWRRLAVFGALTIVGFAVTMLPVVIARAPMIFWVMPIVYALASLAILGRARSTSH